MDLHFGHQFHSQHLITKLHSKTLVVDEMSQYITNKTCTSTHCTMYIHCITTCNKQHSVWRQDVLSQINIFLPIFQRNTTSNLIYSIWKFHGIISTTLPAHQYLGRGNFATFDLSYFSQRFNRCFPSCYGKFWGEGEVRPILRNSKGGEKGWEIVPRVSFKEEGMQETAKMSHATLERFTIRYYFYDSKSWGAFCKNSDLKFMLKMSDDNRKMFTISLFNTSVTKAGTNF